MLEHVFAPFLECYGDAVMFAKQNVVLDHEYDVAAMAIVFSLIKVALVAVKIFFWVILESFCVFFAFNCFCSIIESAANEMCYHVM